MEKWVPLGRLKTTLPQWNSALSLTSHTFLTTLWRSTPGCPPACLTFPLDCEAVQSRPPQMCRGVGIILNCGLGSNFCPSLNYLKESEWGALPIRRVITRNKILWPACRAGQTCNCWISDLLVPPVNDFPPLWSTLPASLAQHVIGTAFYLSVSELLMGAGFP